MSERNIEHDFEAPSVQFWSGLDFQRRQMNLNPDIYLINRTFLSEADQARFLHALYLNFETPNFTYGNPETDEEDFHLSLPYSDINGWVYETEFLAKARRRLDIEGLSGIRSLSQVSFAMVDQASDIAIPIAELPENRLNHSLVVARTMEAIMRNNDFSEDEVNLGIVSALLHDIATPGAGDATKSLDPEVLHEEDYWWENLDEEAWKFIESTGADFTMIDNIIHNRGVLGKILDIADRIGYVMLDLKQIGEDPILPDLGNIYKDVVYDRERNEVYFNDSERLKVFLGIRAKLFRDVYINPYSQSTDYIFARLLNPYYSRDENEEGRLLPEQLRVMSDEDLKKFLSAKYGAEPWFMFHEKTGWLPHYIRCSTEEEAIIKAEEIKQDPENKLIGIKRGYGFNSATDFRVKDPVDGSIISFKQYAPLFAKALDQAAEKTKGHFVVYAKREDPDWTRFIPEP